MPDYGQNIPAPERMLLDFIAQLESGGDANVIYAHKQSMLPKPITQMTLAEVQKWQAWAGRQFRSSAFGKYQHIRKTLAAQIATLDLPTDTLFTEGLQDDLGWHLMRQRGLDGWLAGNIETRTFALQLAREWASLPVLARVQGGSRVVKRGQSYYAGDGLNKALATPEAFEKVLADALALHRSTIARNPVTAPEAGPDALDAAAEGDDVAAVARRLAGLPDAQFTKVQTAIALAAVQRAGLLPERGREDNTMNDVKQWFQSKAIWGAIAALGALIGPVFGLDLGSGNVGELQIAINDLIAAIGAIVALYGRIVATSKIG